MGTRQVCELTPGGRGAVCVLQLQGDELAESIDAFFNPAGRGRLSDQPFLKPVYGFWCTNSDAATGDAQGRQQEDIIVCRRTASLLEIHCHGGFFARQRILDSLKSACFEVKSWQEWPHCDWLDPEIQTAIASAAARRLPLTQTLKTAAVLNWQVCGALDRAIADCQVHLREGRGNQAAALLDELLGWRNLARHLTEPWRVAIVGPPNVGKSSLMNRLAGFERSIVFDQPGTTRDLVTSLTAINGWPVELIDTAGIRESAEGLEVAGIGLARTALQTADLAILVRDATRRALDLAIDELTRFDKRPVVQVDNKMDLVGDAAAWQVEERGLPVSALTGEGIETLLQTVARQLVPVEPAMHQPIPFCPEHFALLEQARVEIGRGKFLAAEATLHALGQGPSP
jgi:tRNA modification GTPase